MQSECYGLQRKHKTRNAHRFTGSNFKTRTTIGGLNFKVKTTVALCLIIFAVNNVEPNFYLNEKILFNFTVFDILVLSRF